MTSARHVLGLGVICGSRAALKLGSRFTWEDYVGVYEGKQVGDRGVAITTLLLVLVAGIGAGFVGYAVGVLADLYPALLAFGIPPVLSNATNTVGVCGTGIGGLRPRARAQGPGTPCVAVYACIVWSEAAIGGLLLLELPAKVFAIRCAASYSFCSARDHR